jgi:hypothetical protein
MGNLAGRNKEILPVSVCKKIVRKGQGRIFFMKQRMQGMVFGIFLTVLLLSAVPALASAVTRNISVTYRNIRLVVNGEHVTPRDGNGNIVEPFIFDGTTYLPIRAVGQALGQDVRWDGNTSTIYIGSGGDGAVVRHSWLDHMQHLNHQQSGSNANVTSWTPGSQSTDGTTFDRGLRFRQDSLHSIGWQSIDVALNSNYNMFTGTLVSGCSLEGTTQVKIYGDERLLYTSPMISSGTIPVSFSVDVSNVLLLKIYVENFQVSGATRWNFHQIGIVEARFER